MKFVVGVGEHTKDKTIVTYDTKKFKLKKLLILSKIIHTGYFFLILVDNRKNRKLRIKIFDSMN